MPEPGVEFSVKELFLEVNRKIDILMDTVHTKASTTDLNRLEIGLSDLQRKGSDSAQLALRAAEDLTKRVTKLERETATIVAVDANTSLIDSIYRNSKYQWIGIIIALASVVVAFVTRH